MEILDMTLKGKWFDQILSGRKKIEYREIKPYWTSRLFEKDGSPKEYDIIRFRNGYSKDCRKMKVQFLGVKRSETHYEILLGNVLK